MTHPHAIRRVLLAAALTLPPAAGLRAQTASTTTTTTTTTPAAADQVVTLSPFDVSASQGTYEPNESTTGARIDVQLKDLPFAVSSINSDYLKDFGVQNLSDQLAFASSMNGLNDVGGFNLRGYGGNISLRNGYSRLGFFPAVEIKRVEFIKGPAAAVYGQTNPGGIVNFITKTPSPTPEGYLQQSFGSFRYQDSEGEFSSTIPTGGSKGSSLGVIVDASYNHQFYVSPNQASTDRVAYTDVVYNFTPTTSLSFDFDYDYQSYTGGTSGVALPLIVNVNAPTTAINRFTGIAWSLDHRTYIDASQWNHRTTFQYESIFQSKLTSFLDFRLGGGLYNDPRFTYSDGISGSYDPTTGNLIGDSGRPSYNYLQGNGRMGSADLVAHYDFPGQGEQRTLFTTDYYDNIGKRPLWQTPTGTLPTTFNVFHPPADPQFPILRASNAAIAGAISASGAVPFTAVTNSGGVMEDDYAAATGASLRHYGNFFDNKLIVALGIRLDHVQEFKEALVGTNPGVMTTLYKVSLPNNWSKQIGLGYRITPDVTVYANRTESFVPNSPSNTTLPGASGTFAPIPNQTGVGYEAGVKASLPNNPRISFTADAYTIKLNNVSVTETDVNGNTFTGAVGTQYSKGVEFDGSWQATDQLQLLGSVSYDDAYYGNQGADLDLPGRKTSGVPAEQGTLAAAWHLTRSVLLTADARAYSDYRVSNSGNVAVNNVTPKGSNDGRREIFAPGYGIFDVGAQYELKGGGVTQDIQVSVKNLLNKKYAIVGGTVIGNPIGLYVTYRIAH